MNKQENRLTISVLTTLIAGIALIYTLIRYHDLLFAVAGVSILFLIAAFFLTQNLIAFSLMRNKSLNVHLKEYIDDISAQIEALGEAQSQIGKANYVYTRQAAQTLATLDSNYTESQNALFKNLASISSVQNKAAKLNIKYDLDNTTKIIAAIKESRNQLNDTMLNGFDHIQPDNTDVISVLTDIVNYLKTQTNGMNQGMELQLNNVAHELQNISNSIQQVQAQGTSLPVPPSMPVQAASYPDMTNPSSNPAQPADVSNVAHTGQDVPDTAQTVTTSSVEDTVDTENTANTEEITTLLEDIHTLMTEDAEGAVDTSSPVDAGTEVPIAVDTSPVDAGTEVPIAVDTASSVDTETDSTMDAETTTSVEMAPASSVEAEQETFTPTFTVVENPAPVEAASPAPVDAAPEPAADVPASSGPNPAEANKMLSPDEIAALFASQSSEEPANTVSEPAPVDAAPEPVADVPADAAPNPADANKMLSPDEIAALFASMG